MLYKEFFGLLFLGFVGWVLLAGSGGGRIDRFCGPVGWSGNVVVSVSALATGPAGQKKVQDVFNRAEYGCRYVTWRLFYQKDYNKWQAEQSTRLSAAPIPPVAAPLASAPALPHLAASPAVRQK